jgi:hypothetical protein
MNALFSYFFRFSFQIISLRLATPRFTPIFCLLPDESAMFYFAAITLIFHGAIAPLIPPFHCADDSFISIPH